MCRQSAGIERLLRAADEVIAMATEMQPQGRPDDAFSCALVAAEYLRAARAMQDMKDAGQETARIIASLAKGNDYDGQRKL